MLYELRVIYLELSIPISMNRVINKAETRLFPSKVSKLKIVLTSKWWRETLQRQRKSKHTTLEGSNVAVANTVLTTPCFFHLEISINIVSYNMPKIESFHRGELGMTKYDKITCSLVHGCHEQATIQKMKLDKWAFLYWVPVVVNPLNKCKKTK